MKKFGTPNFMNVIVRINVLLALSAFILAIIATTAPTWLTFVTRTNIWYSIGIFQACRESSCSYAWQIASPIWTVSTAASPAVYQSWYYYDFTPAVVASAQAFYVLGIIINSFAFCFWFLGSVSAAVSLLITNIFYTIGFACAAAFFVDKQDNVPILALKWGYAAQCAVASLILTWVAFFVFLVDGLLEKKKNKNEKDIDSNSASSSSDEEQGKVVDMVSSEENLASPAVAAAE
jgi:hypothetical protein